MEKDNEYGIAVRYQPGSPNDVLYDLVAVHGLNGDAFGTWTSKETGAMWLRDFLPRELPNVRIMTYGYNAKFRNLATRQDLRSISMKLLSELVDLRKNANEVKRPVIFVCHSLGGIVVKKALVIRCPAEQARVQKATYGIMFLATPHCGSGTANTGKLIANIVATCSPLNPAQGLLGLLRRNSKALFEISEEFVEKVPKLQIVSFYEMKRTSFFMIFSRLIVEQPSAVLNVPNEVRIGQFADHRDIARFSSLEDRNYRPVLTRLLKFGQDLTKKLSTRSPRPRKVFTASKLDADPIFEIPFDRCVTSHGRERLLQTMESYFNQPNPNRQLIYALTGLGGSGKTHSALQYALRNRFKYKSGVPFFNAASKTTLISDFHRIHELLPLANAPDKVESLKKWLSNPAHRDWLIIFDGVDDLKSVPILEHFPLCSWGHIIVTSRDQAVIGLVTPTGQLVEPLEEEAAVRILLEKSAFGNPSEEDLKQARAIVDLLGYLPLAVDQAGAFIRRRQKSLKGYHHLFITEKAKVLSTTPSIGHNDRAVAAVWELNFRQLEKEAPNASCLLMILSFLEGGDIPESMLCRGFSTKKVWGRNGEIGNMTAQEAGLDPKMIALFNDEMALDLAIEQLLTFSLIQRNNSRNERRVFSVHPLVQHCASQRVSPPVRRKWQVQAILLIAHAFPYNQHIEHNFFNIGREMIAHVPQILREFDDLGPDAHLPPLIRETVGLLLLSAVKFRNSSRSEFVRRYKDLLKDSKDPTLKAFVVEAESRYLRSRGDIAESSSVLKKHGFDEVQVSPDKERRPDARLHASIGRLVLSYAENLIKDGQIAQAETELKQWKPLHSELPSEMEKVVLQYRNVTLGRVTRNKGLFQEALDYLQEIYNDTSFEDCHVSAGWKLSLLSHIADLNCETGNPNRAEGVLIRWQKLFCAQGCRYITTGMRMQLSLIETFIRRGMFEIAEKFLWRLVPAFEAITDPNMEHATGHFRVWVGLARIAHLGRSFGIALARWNQALKIVEASGWTTGFSHGIILYSLAQVFFQAGKPEDSQDALEKAQKSLAAEERKYWIVGMGSYWYDYVVTAIGEEGPSPILQRSMESLTKDYDLIIDRFFES